MKANEDMSQSVTVLLCGVGGQGTILAADLLARTIMEAGYDVKLSEVHGMAQRGGAVTTVVRYGKKVHSMVTDEGCADYIIAFETTEALRNCAFLKESGAFLVNDESIKPLPVLMGKASMPSNAQTDLVKLGATLIPAWEMAEKAGSSKSTNVVLLGALAANMEFPAAMWERQIKERVPARLVDTNIAAFRFGLTFAQEANL